MAGKNLQRGLTSLRLARESLGTVADLVGVGGFMLAVLAIAVSEGAVALLLAGFLCLLVIGLLVRIVHLSRRARQSDALPRLVDAVEEISAATRNLLAGGTDDAFVTSVKIALGHLAEMYGIATSAPCRVTLKVVYQPPRRPDRRDFAVKTVCRSSGEAGGQSPSGIDWINDNTDFRKIFTGGQPLFFCNDLPSEPGYRNSHLTDEMVAAGTYPYLATIVWPVRGRGDRVSQVDRWDVIGFLCVDSTRSDVFDREIDVVPGEACAHALYSGLLRFRENQGAPRTDGVGNGRTGGIRGRSGGKQRGTP